MGAGRQVGGGGQQVVLGRNPCPRGYISGTRVGGHCHGDRGEHDHGLDHIVHGFPCSSQLRQNLGWALLDFSFLDSSPDNTMALA